MFIYLKKKFSSFLHFMNHVQYVCKRICGQNSPSSCSRSLIFKLKLQYKIRMKKKMKEKLECIQEDRTHKKTHMDLNRYIRIEKIYISFVVYQHQRYWIVKTWMVYEVIKIWYLQQLLCKLPEKKIGFSFQDHLAVWWMMMMMILMVSCNIISYILQFNFYIWLNIKQKATNAIDFFYSLVLIPFLFVVSAAAAVAGVGRHSSPISFESMRLAQNKNCIVQGRISTTATCP